MEASVAQVVSLVVQGKSTFFIGLFHQQGIDIDPDKHRVFEKLPHPKTVKEIQLFLGSENFYVRFIYKYSGTVVPLTRLTQKDIAFLFTDKCEEAFSSSRRPFLELLSSLILTQNLQLLWKQMPLIILFPELFPRLIQLTMTSALLPFSRTIAHVELNYCNQL